MRILISSLNEAHWLPEYLSIRAGWEVASLHAARVDLGDFGVSAPPLRPTAAYTRHILPVFPQRPYPYSLYLGGLGRVLRDYQPEIIYLLSEPSELNTAQLVRAARRYCPHSRIFLFVFENVLRSWRGFPKCLRGQAERYVLSQLDGVAACTHSARRVLEQRGFPPGRIRVVYQAVGGDFSPQPEAALRQELAAPEAFLVGYVGRLVPEKGIDLLLQALAQLPPQFVLAVVGSGRHEQALRELATRLGVAERVRWLGRIPREKLPRYLSTFDTLVLPSRSLPDWQEQFGAVLVESMYCETPVIGSSSGAIPEVIGDTGLVFAEESAAELAKCLQRLAADPAWRQQLGQAGRQRALREFTLETYVQRLVALFEEATGST